MSETQSNVAEFSVSEISFSIKRTMEDAFGYVRVRGELGRISRPGSGHIYLDLKDDRSVLSGVIWRGAASKLKIQPEQGLEVIATGKITTFPGQSKYQMVIDSLEPAGAGALMALLEERKKKLAAEGLFAEERKRPLPPLPSVIGVVTSPTGAVIRDILHRIADRFPLHVLVWPVRVQGETSGAEVANGIRGFNALQPGGPIPRPDVLIVARGGGSIEDLWGFNEEAVVRAAADSQIPLISAVGHETDWTLIDLAADLRAPTPTGAAEFAVPVKAELMAMVDDRSRRLNSGLVRFVTTRRTELRAASAALPAPQDLLALPRQKFDTLASSLERALIVSTRTHRTHYQNFAGRLSPLLLSRLSTKARQDLVQASERKQRALQVAVSQKRHAFEALAVRLTPARLAQQTTLGTERLSGLGDRLDRAYLARLSQEKARLDGLQKLLKSLSYKDVLARGYAVVRDDSGQPVRSAAAIASGAALSIELADGTVDAVALSDSAGPKPAKVKKPATGKGPATSQGSLF
ncbi:Exodeoxyribonuclease 7 large subunit [Labrenzia sp. THAF191b]|uniref:exodeoxyribonuclease VII large subunit n=1 Tax=unclassified Labrenzia TaxID=2648686 RepID=UPI001267F660|nr:MULTISPECIES: exodeoxyribonuclease VII large subunit [unclassified Labrenzia]MEC9419040.1 exodeoxyribonuclease VII large subunit [Pseudomonadota bacterium]QFS96018.1 Exodeoxyribonuclease 7 large subunit [Labrenzia sp. THAF191b]QFT02333.1 Exodeoxyribonuclease 7 large subunit [Labrenzia sp. THAF191a]QFT13874.1 Exodeoxyribonuclease 7 large subunit [Labrenzia sp. THAF187b]